MTTSASNGYVSFAVQAAKYNDSRTVATFNPSTVTWLNHRAIAADISMQQFQDQLPPEVGSGLFSSGMYKMGAFASGGYSLAARLEKSLGYLLYAAAGKATAGTASSGTYTGSTFFEVNPSDDTSLPWISLRRWVPGPSTTTGVTEYFIDCRVAALAITIPAMGFMRTEFTFVGRKPAFADDKPAAGTGAGQFGAAFEDASSMGMSCEGSISLPSFQPQLPNGGKFTGAQIILANGLSRPQDEMIVGSSHPDDFAPLSRGAVVRLIYKWEDSTLYKYLAANTGALDGNGLRYWTPTIRSSAVTITSRSADVAATNKNQYGFIFTAPSVDWTASPVTLAPQQMLQMELVGTVKQATVGAASWQIVLENAETYSDIVTA